MIRQRIIIQDLERPREHKFDKDLFWMCDSLGFMSGRDTEHTSFKIMQELLDQFKTHDIIATESIAKALNLDAPRVNHHIRNFTESGFVFREKRKIALRGGSLTAALEEMKRDSDRMFERLMDVAKKIDGALEG